MALIEDYALIGDCRSAALVSREGSIDWFCCPRFDSEACFAALLGSSKHGRWLIAPRAPARVTRRYRPNTLVLETHFETEEGAATLIDFMPLSGHHSTVVRMVIGTRGKLAMHTELILRFGYGAIVPWVTRLEDGALRAIAGPDMMILRTPVQLRGADMTTVGEFVIHKDDTIPFVLNYYRSHLPIHTPLDPMAALGETETFWQDWSAKCRPAGPWTDAVMRSMITLKALTYAPTGGMVAAPTTSLPEQLGGERNWDYRYCWLRDATLVLLGAMNAGFFDEAQAWREWLLRAVAGSPGQLQIMYGIAGERRLTEWTAPWLPGYENSAPVRIGNAAHSQLQLDVFGEIMDVHHQARRRGLRPTSRDGKRNSPSSNICNKSGGAPTKGFGKSAAHRNNSPIQRSWPGSRSTARSKAPRHSGSKDRSTNGARCGTRSSRRYAPKALTRNWALSFRPMAPSMSTPACC